MSEFSGIFGLILLICDIWAIVSTVSSAASVGKKVLWIVIVLLLPFLGFILWLLFGPRASKSLSWKNSFFNEYAKPSFIVMLFFLMIASLK